MTKAPKVSFSETSVVILIPRLTKREKSKFWHSSTELSLSKVMWARSIQKVQAMDANESNETDASDYMGLERYLSKELAHQCDTHRKHYIRSVIDMQLGCSVDMLARFAQSQSRAEITRSHKIAMFYANRHFQEPKKRSNSSENKDFQSKYSCSKLVWEQFQPVSFSRKLSSMHYQRPKRNKVATRE
ncbi:hypothetical protein ACHAWO_001967 [Cyclotella atomus]|uniref:Uncharacterized protein n=1 Tax=Cyclotella atomus TaxID=382360 RepID=A0ABD3MLU7_9STRA